ncbi:LysR family transcriptional regulator [Mesorhizobium sp. M4B.F.Ca.ET.190.01.1.1]|uniref:LysR substrate-binding domain-containing protein n=1 Tax=unclassified Mesorhizobium TaxID=325217 RepID=UPI001092FDE6|nr:MULTISPECIES: LysR substrate-binding domain-containing protein [unclassified Mesorhizobium]TGR10494.1 LysR family transcriptional regulator [Mesorhizobium sp. M4B.F.Ca.ET.200.01.1.1]TGS19584.1 LysR family transcriptional regulator [Mesorhizobium sp. M4B.F.Ca.ET.190.01.1.1]TGT32449.1 LysR family transcriptional regulator [Mesorhizobium sp. M4B.F.Ca.ET.172.01.1.1]
MFALLLFMSNFRKSIPSIASLVAFESSARLLSFTRAAQELGVTQAAVSRQIRELEEFLGVSLFKRTYRSIELTAEGLILNGGLPTQLQAVAALCERVRATQEPRAVVVGMTSAFGTNWLTPRLPEFRQLYPEVELRLAVNDEIVDLARQRIDISIRYGTGRWPNLRSKFLLGASDMPVCSPAYWQGRQPPAQPEALLDEVLISLEGAPVFMGSTWADWFAANGVTVSRGKRGFTVNHFTMLIQAALGGQGIALAGFPLIDDLLASGLLVPAINAEPLKVPGGYFVVEPEGEPARESSGLFRSWLFDRVRRDALAKPNGGRIQ